MENMLRLRVKDSDQAVVCGKSRVKIGSHLNCALRLGYDANVARIHAVVENGELLDMSTAQGTRVNGKRVKQCVLKPGDEILVGNTTIMVEEAEERMSYGEEVKAALRHVESAVDHYYETVLEAPEPKRKRIFESFKTVANAADSCSRYAERMMLLERRIEACRKIFDGATSVEIEPAPTDTRDVSSVLNDFVLVAEKEQQLRELIDEARVGLKLAAKALDIAESWNLYDVQVEPPKEWGLEASDEDPEAGWCSTTALARKLRELAKG
jgi:hypothetical protein